MRRRSLLCCALLLLASRIVTAQFLTPSDVNALPNKPPDHRIAYGTDPLQFADLRLPSGPGPHPVAVVIHGGCWVSQFADLQNSAALADALRDAGVATWNIEYRRTDNPGGGWPGTFLDAGRAADYLREIAPKYHLDLKRVVAIGHSAGGHLALWLAARNRLPPDSELYAKEPLHLRGAIVLGGPGDLKASRAHLQGVCGDKDVVAALLGGSPEQVPDHYRQGSPAEMLPLGVLQVFITGAQDHVVPPEFAEAYKELARHSGDTVLNMVVENAAHHEYNAPTSTTWPSIKEVVLSFLGEFLNPIDVNALPSKPADHRIAYGRDPLQFADLRLPKGPGPHPVAIVVHGGCWVSQFADAQNTAALADALRDAGVATWNIEYRRTDNPGGGWPGTFLDVGRAADYLREVAPKYHLDLKRVVTIGHSAGATLALWLAARHRLPQDSVLYVKAPLRPRGAIVLGGAADLRKRRAHLQSLCGGQDVVAALIGGTPEQVPDHYRQGSPAEMVPLGVPQVFITGAQDRVVPPDFAEAYKELAQHAGDNVRHVVIEHAAHHEYNAPSAVTWSAIMDAVQSLLNTRSR